MLEIRFPVRGAQRKTTPLFLNDQGLCITYSLAYRVLTAIKRRVLSDRYDASLFTFHSFRVTLATQLGAMGCSHPMIQAICRWQSAASLLIYNRMQPKQALSMVSQAQTAEIESYTAANLPILSSQQLVGS